MSRYRSEEASLRVRIRAAQSELAALDRHNREGRFARTSFSRTMYELGLAAGRLWRRLTDRSDASRIRRLRTLAERLEQRLAEQQAQPRQG